MRNSVSITFASIRPGRVGLPARYSSELKGVYRVGVSARFDTVPVFCTGTPLRYDSVRFHLKAGLCNRFDSLFPLRDRWVAEHSLVRFVEGSGKYASFYDVKAFGFSVTSNTFDAVADYPNASSSLRFRISIPVRDRGKNHFDTISRFLSACIPRRHSLSIPQQKQGSNRFASLFSVSDLPPRIHKRVFVQWQIPLLRAGRYVASFHVDKGLAAHFRPCRFASSREEYSTRRFDWQSFVRPGWKILARNIETSEVTEIGFIDADSETKELCDVSLPDGVYEISVLTSSLFWKNARDHKLVTITVGKDIETITLPMIYHLRSVVQLGVTKILWSATQSNVTDCTFGLWFAESSPVDTQRPPDTTVFYSSQVTEYSTTFSQREHCYVAVAAINDTEMSKVHELYLDWSTDKPPAPQDVVVLDRPLPVFNRPPESEDANTALAF